jgi:hypothetical protein
VGFYVSPIRLAVKIVMVIQRSNYRLRRHPINLHLCFNLVGLLYDTRLMQVQDSFENILL